MLKPIDRPSSFPPGLSWQRQLDDATRQGDLAAVNWLLNMLEQEPTLGDVNAIWSTATTDHRALHTAITLGHAAMVQRLLRCPTIDVEAPHPHDRRHTPLFHALLAPTPGTAPIVTALLDAGARTGGTVPMVWDDRRIEATLPHLAVMTVSTPEVLDVLHHRGLMHVRALDAEREGVLHRVLDVLHARGTAFAGDPGTTVSPTPTLLWLLAHGADPQRRDKEGRDVVERLRDPQVLRGLTRTVGEEQAPAAVQAVERWILTASIGPLSSRLNGPMAERVRL